MNRRGFIKSLGLLAGVIIAPTSVAPAQTSNAKPRTVLVDDCRYRVGNKEAEMIFLKHLKCKSFRETFSK